MATKLISRADAIARGLKRYFTGVPCKHGHISESFVSNCGCTECSNDRAKKWGKNNADRKHETLARFIDRNPDYPKKWAQENKASINAAFRKWYSANPERGVKASRQWAINNPEKVRARCRNRAAKRKSASGSHTAEQILEMLKKQKWKCVYCGVSIKAKRHIDHRIPLALEGSNDISNLQGLCPTCNCRKSAKDPIEWDKVRGILL